MRSVTTNGSPPMEVASASEQREDLAATRASFARNAARAAELAQRHRPLAAFTLGTRVEITAPRGAHRPLSGRSGAVILVNESGSAWVRVELPQGRTVDHCFAASECSAEVES